MKVFLNELLEDHDQVSCSSCQLSYQLHCHLIVNVGINLVFFHDYWLYLSFLKQIRGIQNLIIYSLPERKEFYPEVVNLLQGSACTVLFSRFDQLRLERIVGTAASKRMVTSDKGVFVFC
ncbi:hypothetical protein H5410_035610 [Solanum commersonii]|uniref:UTP25 C-terminal domain-containing protein n=1 Tax=Solanum commersonii TaxID=4109 RepID=A0A9J5Y344_SOLCO|nr:hypothetical protein H5410_035610 [Solanum commersonii]